MKYLRFICKHDIISQGIIEPNGVIKTIRGDVLSDYEFTDETYRQEDIKQYLPPVDAPNIIALGLNYREHAREAGGRALN